MATKFHILKYTNTNKILFRISIIYEVSLIITNIREENTILYIQICFYIKEINLLKIIHTSATR